MAERGLPAEIGLDRLLLNLGNPRHEPVVDRDEAMIALLGNEQILELARDIVSLGGINPMERMGVFPLDEEIDGQEDDEEGEDGEGEENEDPFYVAAEGNRRLCALLLLDDPEAVPANMPNRQRYVRSFTQLSERLPPLDTVPCVVFDSMEDARPWLERLHNGARDGSGRRRWTPEQQARNTSDITNRAATQLRDLAIRLGIVTVEQLARTTTTQQRFISNVRFRQALGIVRLDSGDLERVSCWNDFELMLRRFMNGIASGEINSRTFNTGAVIEDYARALTEIEGLQRRTVPQGPLERRRVEAEDYVPDQGDERNADADDRGGQRRPPGGGDAGERHDPEHDVVDEDEDEAGGPGDDADREAEPDERARRRRRLAIGLDDQILAALHRVDNQKLTDLYQSSATVRHPAHTLLAVVGCWSFLECLTRAHGRQERTDFTAYINGRVQALNVEDTPERRVRNLSLGWIATGGNITKHDWQAATYDATQLFNAMDALQPIIVAILDDIADRAGRGD